MFSICSVSQGMRFHRLFSEHIFTEALASDTCKQLTVKVLLVKKSNIKALNSFANLTCIH